MKKQKMTIRTAVEQLDVALGVCAEIEDLSVTSDNLAGNYANAERRKGRRDGLLHAQAMIRVVLDGRVT